MKVLHLSAECYPAAKVGGLADVVGALPKYLNAAGVESAVVMPKYGTRWINNRVWESRFDQILQLGSQQVWFSVQECVNSLTDLGFRLFAVHIPGLFDRPGVYADPNSGNFYGDEVSRNIAFQRAVLQWVSQFAQLPQLIHCHDHHTGLVPFMMKHCPQFSRLAQVPSTVTVHNGNYSGAFSWNNAHLLPQFRLSASGLIDWNNTIDPLVAAFKNSWGATRHDRTDGSAPAKFVSGTTVSPSYANEVLESNTSLGGYLRASNMRLEGILNGIDTEVWDPKTDSYLPHLLLGDDVEAFKAANKLELCNRFNLDAARPLIVFIGRFAAEKGAQLLPEAFRRHITDGGIANFIVLGNGNTGLEAQFANMAYHFQGRFACALEYNEGLSHQMYAGADFLIMPSLVEPCGLNQMYALRYGTIPIVRSVGGLIDSVTDIGIEGGYGIRFDRFDVEDCYFAIARATQVFTHATSMHTLRRRTMALNFSWERAVNAFTDFYRALGVG